LFIAAFVKCDFSVLQKCSVNKLKKNKLFQISGFEKLVINGHVGYFCGDILLVSETKAHQLSGLYFFYFFVK